MNLSTGCLFAIISLVPVLTTSRLAAQDARPAFEVASIKPVETAVDRFRSTPMRVGINVTGTRADFGFVTLADLVTYAYRVKPFQISGPAWMHDARWEIVAKLLDGSTSEKVPEMMQTLLAERFKLLVHHESHEASVYELVVDKGGLKIKESAPEDSNTNSTSDAVPSGSGMFVGGVGSGGANIRVSPDGKGAVITGGPAGSTRIIRNPSDGGMRLEMSRTTMTSLADILTPFMDKPVIDRTGLNGSYDAALDLPREALMNAMQNLARSGSLPPEIGGLGGPNGFGRAGAASGQAPVSASEPAGASSLFQAVQQLGLRLQSVKAPVDTLVIDHLEKTPVER